MQNESNASSIVDVVSHGNDVYLEHLVPTIANGAYHTHPSIEMNYLRGCEMTYSFSGELVTIPREKFCAFWSAYPHRPTHVTGAGEITNAYLSLKQFLDFGLSSELVDTLLSGAVVCAKKSSESDRVLFDRWAEELNLSDRNWDRLHRLEVQTRFARLDAEGWDLLSPPRISKSRTRIGGNAVVHFDKMLRFVAHHAFEPITVKDVADAAGISSNYAIIHFRNMLGVTVKEYILGLRIHHAKMILLDSNDKILNVAFDCGFSSMSAFYEAFGTATGMSPSAFRAAHNAT